MSGFGVGDSKVKQKIARRQLTGSAAGGEVGFRVWGLGFRVWGLGFRV